MDIFDIIIHAPEKPIIFEFDISAGYITAFIVISLIVVSAVYRYKKIIAIICMQLLQLQLKSNKVEYKHFAFSIANVLAYYHDLRRLDKNAPPINSSKDKHYLWISLIDNLDSIRYKKNSKIGMQDSSKIYDLAVEWIKST